MNAPAAYGLLAHGLLFGALTALLPLGDMRPRVALAATTLSLLVGMAPAMHGIFGSPSLTLLVLAILQLAGRTPSPLSGRAALVLLIFALAFYGAVLSGWPVNLYALGYQPAPLLAALIPLGLVLLWKGLDNWLLILAVDLAGYASGLFVNLWDALLDPLLVLLALAVVLRWPAARLIASRRR